MFFLGGGGDKKKEEVRENGKDRTVYLYMCMISNMKILETSFIIHIIWYNCHHFKHDFRDQQTSTRPASF